MMEFQKLSLNSRALLSEIVSAENPIELLRDKFKKASPETNCQGLFNQIHKKGARSTVWLLTPRLIDYIFPFSRSLQRYA